MSDVNTQAAAEAASDPFANMSEDDALGAMFDQFNADDAGQDRGADGRFAAAQGAETPADPDADPNGQGDDTVAAGEGQDTQPAAADPNAPPAVALPANWTGMDEDWKKIPADVQAKIAARDTELHARMSEQGRQLGAFKPFTDVIERNQDVLADKVDDQGKPVTAAYAVNFLLSAQREIDRDPVRSLIDIADRYGVRQALVGVLTGQLQLPPAQQPQRPAGMTPADVEAKVQEALSADQQNRAANEEVSRLSQDKPLYSQIAEQDMVHAIHKARHRLGDTASNEAVFNLAYDMAVHADPDLRAKAAAAAKPAAPQPDQRRTQDARRAASINVTSTSPGKGRKLTEDEELGAAFDAAQKDR